MPILIPILQGLRLFDSLPTARLAEVAAVMGERRVERREVVIKRGQTDAGLGFLIEGRLQTVNFTLDGREVGIDFIENGDFFGELSVIDGQPAPEYIIAVAPSRLTFLDRDRARELMFSTPAGAAAVAERLAARMRRAASLQPPAGRQVGQQFLVQLLASPGAQAGEDDGISSSVCPLRRIMSRARSTMRTGSPMSSTSTSPLSPMAAACSTSRAASGMVMK
jgi:CRP-like cAMP-binding protein